MKSQIDQTIKLRDNGEEEQARQIFIELVRQNRGNAELNFHCAQTHDGMGLEEEAVDYYEKAIEIGLPDELLKDAYVCLGSTYKVIGEYEKSLEVLTNGEEKFPHYEPLKAFKSLTLHSMGDHSKALETALVTLLKTTNDKDLQKYSRALHYYAGSLEE
ncbi:tetratricopeptide repeat protein [Virgibacillus flavescens]|uniref:tetratricopeptide repeat protein n=1 Tax=Virgibacillus flavescens TaxID=1611422 RepID=UPI003D3363B4